jgi:tocopherol O-methyltransferase
MISGPAVKKASIRWHYNVSTPFYRLLWGPHIHHGLWEKDESPRVAQDRLTESLADLAKIKAGERLLDVGCGMGGSSIHLARWRGCHATGVTISRLQRTWARLSALLQRAGPRTEFLCADAEVVEFPEESFDVVWIVECTEHLFDKPRFFDRASRWLAPGGRIAICAWLAGDEPLDESQRQQVYDVCDGFLCPSLGTAADYKNWMETARLRLNHIIDWTPRVLQTWEICQRRVDRSPLKLLARVFDKESAVFLDRFQIILNAYRTGAMKYGCFVAERA